LASTVKQKRIFFPTIQPNWNVVLRIVLPTFQRPFRPAAYPLCEPNLRKAFLAIYGNGSANKKPGSGSSVLLDYEFYCRYLDGPADFLTPIDEDTLIADVTQHKLC